MAKVRTCNLHMFFSLSLSVSLSLCLSLCLSLSISLSLYLSLSLSVFLLSFSLNLYFTLSFPSSLSHTHTHTHDPYLSISLPLGSAQVKLMCGGPDGSLIDCSKRGTCIILKRQTNWLVVRSIHKRMPILNQIRHLLDILLLFDFLL